MSVEGLLEKAKNFIVRNICEDGTDCDNCQYNEECPVQSIENYLEGEDYDG